MMATVKVTIFALVIGWVIAAPVYAGGQWVGYCKNAGHDFNGKVFSDYASCYAEQKKHGHGAVCLPKG